MKESDNWIVGLDFTSIDASLISYTAFLAGKFSPDNIYFLHVYPDLKLPDEARKALSKLGKPTDESLRDRMRERVAEFFPNYADFNAEFVVVEGKPEKQFLRWASVKHVNLIITGRKSKSGGSGVVPQRLARNAEASILFVPEKNQYSLDTLFVPTDFSKASKVAIRIADLIRKRADSSKIFLFHSCQVPSVIYYEGMAGSTMDELIRGAAEEKFQELLEEIEIEDIATMVDSISKSNPGSVIASNAMKIPADLVIISGHGKFGLGRVLLGSSTESLINNLTEIPVLVIKGRLLEESLTDSNSVVDQMES